jgi:hypothetical protein
MTCAIARMPKGRKKRIFLWGCCEGWVRLGPYAWIGLSEDRNAFINEKGIPVLVWNDHINAWKATDPAAFSGDLVQPMVTTTPVHPKPMSGTFPILEEDEYPIKARRLP